MAVWKAWIEGHDHDLRTLTKLFWEGDPLVAGGETDGWYIQSNSLPDANDGLNLTAADSLIKSVNGVARAADESFEPVRLTNRYTGPDGRSTTFVRGATARLRSGGSMTAKALIDGAPPPRQPARGPRYIRLAKQDDDVAFALRVLGQPDPLDWYDIYKVWEIVKHAVRGRRQVAARGWATHADIERLTASANHQRISGDKARHARMPGVPAQDRVMKIDEADAMVRRLVAAWIEAHPSY